MSAIPIKTLIVPCVVYMSREFNIGALEEAIAQMGAMGLQESEFEARDQLEVIGGRLVPGNVGPACGFWQFEKNGGVAGVMTHNASKTFARKLVELAGVAWDKDAIWRFLATVEGDDLAAAFARLLLLTDPQPLPRAIPESEEEAFQYYLRNWRPGSWFNSAPDSEKRRELRAKWKRNWAASLAALKAYESDGNNPLSMPFTPPDTDWPVTDGAAMTPTPVSPADRDRASLMNRLDDLEDRLRDMTGRMQQIARIAQG